MVGSICEKVPGGGYRGVPQHLGDYFGLDVAREEESVAGVPKVAEADLREPGAFEKRVDGRLLRWEVLTISPASFAKTSSPGR